jgi:hypothetical protein
VALFLGRIAVGSAATWCVLQAVGRVIQLGAPWPLWAWAAIAAGGVESLLSLYALECGAIAPARGRLLLALRLALLGLLLALLLQPVLVRRVKRWIERRVVVLVDDSDSMRFRDPVWAVGDLLDLAALYGVPGMDKRPTLGTTLRDLRALRARIGNELALLRVPAGATAQSGAAVIAGRREQLGDCARQDAATLTAAATRCLEATAATRAGGEAVASLRRAAEQMQQAAAVRTAAIGALIGKPDDEALKTLAALREELTGLDTAVQETLRCAPPALKALDLEFHEGLDQAARERIEEVAQQTRAQIANAALLAPRTSSPSPLRELAGTYHVQLLRFAAETREEATDPWLGADAAGNGPAVAEPATNAPPAPGSEKDAAATARDDSFGAMTDLAGALEEVLATVPSEVLAGVLVVSDGRHNGASGVEAVARRFGAQGAPICTVAIGSLLPPRDAAIVNVRAPESIYFEDRVAVRADLKFDSLQGRKARVTLSCEGETVAEQQVDIPDDGFRTTVRLAHTPAAKGVNHYRLEIEALDGEIMASNNSTAFDVAVTDDRTNVLLIDWRPRWEFRYLRNLFYGRDKSVHLQYVLLEPDKMQDADPAPVVPASAGRKFGDAEATALPASREEWMKFDAIVLGDIPPDALDTATWLDIEACVADRGALLTCIAGPYFMPHAHDSPTLQQMLPATWTRSETPLLDPPEEYYRLRLTPDGRAHVIMQQSASASENDQVWESLPPLQWRHGGLQAKPAATILAYAEPLDGNEARGLSGASVPDAAQELERRMKMRQHNPLVVFHMYGRGRVLLLGFDRTWRFRYRVGDTYHHRFWGQAMRWGAGENLRAGTAFVRLGTDAISYTPRDPVSVLAKLVTPDYKPVWDAEVYVNIYRDNRVVARKRLQYREMSNGIYETKLDPLPDSGRYRIELDSPRANQILADEKAQGVDTEINVVHAKSPAELSELTADRELLAGVAALSGGATAGPGEVAGLRGSFGPGSRAEIEKQEDTLWDKWPLLAAILACATAEWLLRRQAGLP